MPSKSWNLIWEPLLCPGHIGWTKKRSSGRPIIVKTKHYLLWILKASLECPVPDEFRLWPWKRGVGFGLKVTEIVNFFMPVRLTDHLVEKFHRRRILHCYSNPVAAHWCICLWKESFLRGWPLTLTVDVGGKKGRSTRSRANLWNFLQAPDCFWLLTWAEKKSGCDKCDTRGRLHRLTPCYISILIRNHSVSFYSFCLFSLLSRLLCS